MSWSIASLITLLMLGGTFAETPKVISICDVLSNPKRYDRQMITVHALLVSSRDDGDFDELAPLESDRCYRPRRQDNLRVGLGGGGRVIEPPESLKPDWASYDRAEETVAKLREKDPTLKRLLVTVEGMIFDGGPEPSGVTRHPWHPAEMLISTWKDIRQP